MTTLAEQCELFEFPPTPKYETSEEVIDTMLQIAPAGQAELASATREDLRVLTERLVELEGERVVNEHEYYHATAERELELPQDKVRKHLESRTIFVSGGTGLIGTALLSEIIKYNPKKVVSVSRGETQPKKIVPDVDYQHVDIRDKQTLQNIMLETKPDLVYHVAADKYNHEAESRIQHTLMTNIIGTQNMVVAAEAAGAEQFIYASTGKASRPFSGDNYTSSKKVAEQIVASAAKRGIMNCSAGRFTHVVDDSNLTRKIQTWIDNDEPVRIHKPDTLFFIQSAKESAQLLINSGLEAENGTFKVHAIRNLQKPVDLLNFAVGAIAKSGKRVPIYFQGIQPGYEEEAWRGLYHPLTAVEVSPLISSLEADDTVPSETCAEVDVFPLELAETDLLVQSLGNLKRTLYNTDSTSGLKAINGDHGWAMLDARLDVLPLRVLQRTVKHIDSFSRLGPQTLEHHLVNRAIREAVSRRVGGSVVAAADPVNKTNLTNQLKTAVE